MGLAGNDELHGPLLIVQQSQQALRIVQQQVRSLVGGEAPGKTERQCIAVEQSLHIDRIGRRAIGGQLPGQSFASVVNEGLAGLGSELPQAGVGHAANVVVERLRAAHPALLAAGFGPDIVGCR